MFKIFYSFLVFTFITSSSAILSPICDPSVKDLVIDATVLMSKTRIYFFTGKYITVIVVNEFETSIESVDEITNYFKINISDNTTFQTPVLMSFIDTNDKNDDYLALITYKPKSNDMYEWRINIETNSVTDVQLFSKGHHTIKSTLDIINSNTNRSICYYLLKYPDSSYICLMEWSCPSKSVKQTSKHWFLALENQTIGFVDSMPKKSFNQLNGKNITSGLIFEDTLILFADRYATELSTDFGTFINFQVDFIQNILCKSIETTLPTYTTRAQSTSTLKTYTNLDSNQRSVNYLVLIASIVTTVVVIAAILGLIWMFFMKAKSSADKSKTKSKARKVPKPKEKATERKNSQEEAVRQRSEPFSFVSNVDLSKPIPLRPYETESEANISQRPTDLIKK